MGSLVNCFVIIRFTTCGCAVPRSNANSVRRLVEMSSSTTVRQPVDKPRCKRILLSCNMAHYPLVKEGD
eukprot:6981756-Lingulodinium_polyedra.AAC.1